MTATLSLTARHFWEKASIEHSERIGTLETCDQSDEETRPLQQNDKDNDKDKDNDNDKDKDKENNKYKIQNLLTLIMGLYCGTQSSFFFNLHLFYLFRTSALRQCQFARDPNLWKMELVQQTLHCCQGGLWGLIAWNSSPPFPLCA